MKKTVRLDSKKQRVWFVTDLHYGHGKSFIIDPRNYKTLKEAMDDTRQKWKQYISPNDVVINLGDQIVGAGSFTTQYVHDLLSLPYAHQYFLWGNHNAGMRDLYEKSLRDAGHNPDEYDIYPWTLKEYPFTFLGDYAEIIIDHQHVDLFHYPIASWNHVGKGAFMIHGHCHGKLKEDKGLKRWDVDWGRFNRPIEWSEIVRELGPRISVPVDHHGTKEFIENEKADNEKFFET